MDLELQIKSWFALNDKLVNTGEELLKNFSYFENNQRKLIYEGFLRKGINSLKAIQLLTRNNYLEQANILTRSICGLSWKWTTKTSSSSGVRF